MSSYNICFHVIYVLRTISLLAAAVALMPRPSNKRSNNKLYHNTIHIIYNMYKLNKIWETKT